MSLAKPLDPVQCAEIAGSHRFTSKVAVDPETGCHVWTGGTDTPGYGTISVRGLKNVHAHRLALVAALQYDIPADWHVDHLCRNRRCVNVEHLEAVPAKVNILRGQGPTAANARRSTCDKCGARLEPVSSGRRCMSCQRKNWAERRALRREAALLAGCSQSVLVEAIGDEVEAFAAIVANGVSQEVSNAVHRVIECRASTPVTCKAGLHTYVPGYPATGCRQCKSEYARNRTDRADAGMWLEREHKPRGLGVAL